MEPNTTGPPPTSWNPNNGDWGMPESVNLVGSVLYGLVAVVCLLGYILYQLARKKWCKLGLHNLFFLCAFSFCVRTWRTSPVCFQRSRADPAGLVRVAWQVYRITHPVDHASFIINRLGSLLFFSAFTIIVFYWYPIASDNWPPASR